MAEGVFSHVCSKSPLIGTVDSAGTGAYHTLEPPDSRTMSTLRRHGIKGYSHAARQVTTQDFFNFNYLLAMDHSNLRHLLDLRSELVAQRSKTGDPRAEVAEVRLFGDFLPGGAVHERVGGGPTIRDPYYGGATGFEDVYQQVTGFTTNFLDFLHKSASSVTKGGAAASGSIA